MSTIAIPPLSPESELRSSSMPRKVFEIPLRLAAALLGVNFSHLRRVLNGERRSPRLSAAYQELVRAYWGLGRAHQERLCGLRSTRP